MTFNVTSQYPHKMKISKTMRWFINQSLSNYGCVINKFIGMNVAPFKSLSAAKLWTTIITRNSGLLGAIALKIRVTQL